MNESGFRIRPMTTEHVVAANDLARAQGWRDRTDLYRFALRVETCHPLVGFVGERLVATGLATTAGRIGWLGAIAVDAEFRRRGFGRAVTEALIARLWADRCDTISLEATEMGRPMYERMGFRFLCHYVELDGDATANAPAAPEGTRLRTLVPADLPAVLALDALATGEDRSAALRVLAESGGWVLEEEGTGLDGPIRGFLLPSDRGNAAIVAPRPEDGLCLLDLHRHVAPHGHHARSGIPGPPGEMVDRLRARGWEERWRIPRMILGTVPDWRPTWIWGQINSAMG